MFGTQQLSIEDDCWFMFSRRKSNEEKQDACVGVGFGSSALYWRALHLRLLKNQQFHRSQKTTLQCGFKKVMLRLVEMQSSVIRKNRIRIQSAVLIGLVIVGLLVATLCIDVCLFNINLTRHTHMLTGASYLCCQHLLPLRFRQQHH